MIYLEHFEDGEFQGWEDRLCPRLAVRLDILRHRLGRPINISPADGAVGRELGEASESEHNVDFWGEVLAVDCFIGGVYTRAGALDVVTEARALGFTGIGVYPEWKNGQGAVQVGFHFGVRPTRKMADPATWGYVNGQFVALERALDHLTN